MLCARTTSISEFDLHFGPNSKFYVCIFNSLNAIVLPRFADSAEPTNISNACQNTRTHILVHTYKTHLQNHFLICWQTHSRLTQTRRKQEYGGIGVEKRINRFWCKLSEVVRLERAYEKKLDRLLFDSCVIPQVFNPTDDVCHCRPHIMTVALSSLVVTAVLWSNAEVAQQAVMTLTRSRLQPAGGYCFWERHVWVCLWFCLSVRLWVRHTK